MEFMFGVSFASASHSSRVRFAGECVWKIESGFKFWFRFFVWIAPVCVLLQVHFRSFAW